MQASCKTWKRLIADEIGPKSLVAGKHKGKERRIGFTRKIPTWLKAYGEERRTWHRGTICIRPAPCFENGAQQDVSLL